MKILFYILFLGLLVACKKEVLLKKEDPETVTTAMVLFHSNAQTIINGYVYAPVTVYINDELAGSIDSSSNKVYEGSYESSAQSLMMQLDANQEYYVYAVYGEPAVQIPVKELELSAGDSIVMFLDFSEVDCKQSITYDSLEGKYGCRHTDSEMTLFTDASFLVIDNQNDFDSLVEPHCDVIINFDTADFVIGVLTDAGAAGSFATLDFTYNCRTDSSEMTVNFYPGNGFDIADFYYHAIIPKGTLNKFDAVEIITH